MSNDPVKAYESTEEFLAAMQATRDDAIASFEEMPAALVEALQEGNHYVYFHPMVTIFGEIIESEYEEDRAMARREPWSKLVRAYSEMCPEGELGMCFVANMLPISRLGFEKAKADGWDLTREQVLEKVEIRLVQVGLLAPIVPGGAA